MVATGLVPVEPRLTTRLTIIAPRGTSPVGGNNFSMHRIWLPVTGPRGQALALLHKSKGVNLCKMGVAYLPQCEYLFGLSSLQPTCVLQRGTSPVATIGM